MYGDQLLIMCIIYCWLSPMFIINLLIWIIFPLRSFLHRLFLIWIWIYFQYYEHIEEMEWAIEVCLETGLPVAASMCIGPEGDLHGVSSAECAVRMAKAGANVGKLI